MPAPWVNERRKGDAPEEHLSKFTVRRGWFRLFPSALITTANARPSRLWTYRRAQLYRAQEAFHHQQLALLQNLTLAEKSITHQGKRGDVTERHFITTLRAYLSRRYAVDSAIVIDSNGRTSDQMDVVIFDPHYTPTLLDQHDHKYVPAEAVYAVMEVKPTINKKYLKYAGKKAASVRRLKRTSIPIPHAGGTYPAKPLFEITAGLIAPNIEWADGFGPTFLGHHAALKKECRLDCLLAVNSASFDIYDAGVNHTISKGKNALIFFLFRLLQRLQSLGTVPAIDWNTYANQLSKTT